MHWLRFVFIPLIVAFVVVTTTSWAQGTFRDRSSGVNFPTEVSFSGEEEEFTLQATGSDTRKKFFAKVYAIAHYMEDPESGSRQQVFEEVLSDGKAKQFTMEWLRGVSKSKIRSSTLDGFRKAVSGQEMQRINNEIDEFVNFYDSNIRDGDTHVLRWLPGGSFELYINGDKKGEINNEEFVIALWKIWMGPNSVVDENKLVSMITN